MEDEELFLEKDEIRQDMLEEYAFLLCDIGVNEEYIDIENVFNKVADFIVLLVEMYGEEVKDFINDILADNIGVFSNYFD